MATKYEQALALSKEKNIPVPEAVAQVRNQAPVSATSAGNQMQYEINKQNRQNMANEGTIPAVGTSVTPQAGQTQAPTPTTPPPVASSTTPSGATMSADGTVTPATPAPATPPPVTNTTTTSTTPAPVTPTKVEPVKTDVISETKAKNEAQMALNKQQADLKEQERQKIAQENKIASTPTDMQGILNSFIAGTPVAPQKSGNYINAKFQYDQYSKFNAMTPTQLLDNLKQGQIGTEMDKLLSQNPNYVQAKAELDKVQKTNNINSSIKNIYGGVTGQTTETPDYLGMVSNDLIKKLGLDKDMTSAEAFSQYVTGDQKIVDYTNQLSNVNRQIADTSKLINDGIKELKARKGDMPADALVVLLNSTFKDVNETLTNLNNTKTYLEADLKNATEMAFNRYGAVSKDIENARTIKNSVISNLIQSQFNLAEKQTEADLANKIAKEALNDPYKAIPAMIEEYKKLGIPFTRSTQQIIQDFETSGKDLSTYLSDLQGTIQSKPEYKKIQELQAGQLSDAQKLQASQAFDLKKMGLEQNFQMKLAQAKQTTDNKWTKLDDGMYQDASGNIITADELKNAKLLNNSYISKPVGAEGGECGFYASRATGLGSTPGGNSKEARFKAFSETTPQVGGMAFFGGEGYDKTYGHIAIVTGVNADGTITVKDSNYRGDGKVTERKVPASQVSGYYNNTPLAKGFSGGGEVANTPIAQLGQFMKDNQQRGPGYSEEDVKAFNEKIDRFVQNGDQKGIATAFRNNLFQDKDFKQEFDNTKKFTSALDSVQTLINDYEKAGKSTNALTGMAEKVARKLGLTTDQALAQLQTQMGFTLANYIKSISGTAASDVEVQRLMGNMANISNVKDLNTTILSQVKSNADSSLKSMIDTRMYGMPEDLKYDVFADVYQKPSTQKSDFLNSLKSIATEFTKGLTSIK